MELSFYKPIKLLIFQERTDKAPKTIKKSAPKKFLVSFDVFLIFTAQQSIEKFPQRSKAMGNSL